MSPARRLLLAVVAVACVLPLVYLAVLSLAQGWPFPRLLPSTWTLSRWRSAMAGEAGLGASFLLSSAISGAVAAIATAGGFVTSREIAYHRHRRALSLLAYVPYAMSPVVLGTCLLYLALRLGLAGGVPGVVLAQVVFTYGFAVVFFLGWWTAEKQALAELVATLGGSTWQLYRRVLLPLSRGMLVICFFQTFLLSWFQYGLTVLVGGGQVKTLPLGVYDAVGEANSGYAAVAGCLLVAPPVLLLWLNKRFLLRDARG